MILSYIIESYSSRFLFDVYNRIAFFLVKLNQSNIFIITHYLNHLLLLYNRKTILYGLVMMKWWCMNEWKPFGEKRRNCYFFQIKEFGLRIIMHNTYFLFISIWRLLFFKFQGCQSLLRMCGASNIKGEEEEEKVWQGSSTGE